jgi:hypothetical protein
MLIVETPPGMAVRLHLRCLPQKIADGWDTDCLKQFAVYHHFMRGALAAATNVPAYVLCWHDLMAASRTIELVNATRRPVKSPEIRKVAPCASLDRLGQPGGIVNTGGVSVARAHGSLAAKLAFDVAVEVASSGKVRIEAEWHSPDTLGVVGPPARGIITERQLADLTAGPGLIKIGPLGAEHTLPSAGFHLIRYRAVAASRFKSAFDPQLPARDFETTGPELLVPFLNVAPPAALRIAEVNPTTDRKFYTAIEDAKERFFSEQKSLIRIYFPAETEAVGSDELAGVLVWQPDSNAGPPADSALVRRVSSNWGIDPLRPTMVPGLIAQRQTISTGIRGSRRVKFWTWRISPGCFCKKKRGGSIYAAAVRSICWSRSPTP